MKNTAQGGHVERQIQHEVKPSAVFVSRHPPSAVFFIHTSLGRFSRSRVTDHEVENKALFGKYGTVMKTICCCCRCEIPKGENSSQLISSQIHCLQL